MNESNRRWGTSWLLLTVIVRANMGQLASPILVRETETARFSWQIPDGEAFVFVTVISPAGTQVLMATTTGNDTRGDYQDRVTYTGNLSQRTMAFDLRDVTRSDNGTYTCGRNSWVDTIPQCGQKLVVMGRPSKPIISGTAPVVGRQMSLTCSSNSTTIPADHGLTLTYTWKRDGVGVTPPPPPGSNYTFTVTSYNNHTYSCQAREDQGLESEESQGYSLIPQYAPYQVTLTPPTPLHTVREGRETVPPITCSASCRPSCNTYRWYKDGGSTPVSTGDTLALPQAVRAQAGSYRCRAENTHGVSDSSSISVSVTYPPEVTLDTTCQPYRVVEHQQNVRLTCRVTSAYPAVTSYSWTHNGSGIPSATGGVFTISPVTRTSGGTYSCAGINIIASSTPSSLTVLVQYAPSAEVEPTVTVVEGSTLRVDSSVASNPASSLSWTWRHGSGFTPQTDPTLEIPNIHRDQAGVYVLTATNTLSPCDPGAPQGSRSDTAEVRVDVQYNASITSLTPDGPDGVVDELTMVTLKCTVSSNPAASVSLLNGSQELHSSSSPSSEYSFTAGCRQRGNYSCTAQNPVTGGPVSRQVKLLVRCSPRHDESFLLKETFASDKGGNVTLTTTILAFPAPKFTWTKVNGTTRNLTAASHVTFDSDIASSGFLSLADLQEKDFGDYEVTVNNSVGQAALYRLKLAAQGSPSTPTRPNVTTISHNTLKVSWKQEFNGGAPQEFTVEYKKNDDPFTPFTTIDEREDTDYLQVNITGLTAKTVYYIRVVARNQFGQSQYTREMEGLTAKDPVVSRSVSSNSAVVGGAVGGSITALVVIVLVVIFIIRWKRKSQSQPDNATSFPDEPYASLGPKDGNTYEGINISPYQNQGSTTGASVPTDQCYSSLGPRETNTYDAIKVPTYQNIVQKSNPVYENTGLPTSDYETA